MEQLTADESASFFDEQLILEAWQTLFPQTQRMLLMKYEEGMSYEAILSD